MNRGQTHRWLLSEFGVSRETLLRLDRYAAMLEAENTRQNLISRSTIGELWDRHIRDSAQLLALAPSDTRLARWIDLGTGAGLPGIVLAIVGDMQITLVESRRKRSEFLAHAIAQLGLSDQVALQAQRLERIPPFPADVIVARAFAPLPKLFDLAAPFAKQATIWLLPKGKTVEDELAEARRLWQGTFETVQSDTNPDSFIVRASNVRRKASKR